MHDSVETYLAEPHSEVGVQALAEELTQFFLRDGKCAGEDKNLCAHRKVDVKILYHYRERISPYNQGSICHQFIVADRPFNTQHSTLSNLFLKLFPEISCGFENKTVTLR